MNDKQEGTNNELLYAYTRAQAIQDGCLVNVSKMATEAGFTVPVATTRAVFERYIAVPEGVTGQDEAGRLWDVLWMLRYAIHKSARQQSSLTFELVVRNTDDGPAEPVTLRSVCGPGDRSEPVLTVMFPGED